MATTTSNLGLTKPDYTDAADVGVLNGNFDLLDQAIATDRVNNVRHTNVHNLLDNSNFMNPVNQRGQDNYTGIGYAIDRWRTWDDTAVVVVRDGYISHDNSLFQYIPGLKKDQTYTLAVCNSSNVMFVYSGKPEDLGGTAEIAIHYDPGSDVVAVIISGSVWGIKWAALYEGEYTAETLPPYVPKDHAQEIVECLQYCYVPSKDDLLVNGTAISTTTVRFRIPTAVPMRTKPTLTLGSISWLRSGGTSISSPAISSTSCVLRNGQIEINITFSSAILTAYQSYSAQLSGGIVLSADL